MNKYELMWLKRDLDRINEILYRDFDGSGFLSKEQRDRLNKKVYKLSKFIQRNTP